MVDIEVIGKKLISNGKFKRRYIFILLNKIVFRIFLNDVVKRVEGLVSWWSVWFDYVIFILGFVIL